MVRYFVANNDTANTQTALMTMAGPDGVSNMAEIIIPEVTERTPKTVA